MEATNAFLRALTTDTPSPSAPIDIKCDLTPKLEPVDAAHVAPPLDHRLHVKKEIVDVVYVDAHLYHCDFCDFLTPRKRTITDHLRTHPQSKPYQCPACSYAAADPAHLRRHRRAAHQHRDALYRCAQCAYTATRKQHLKTHMMSHRGERPYKCGECAYASARKHDLAVHMRRHSAVRAYTCALCGYASNYKTTLAAHIARHVGERPFKCGAGRCGFAAADRSTLRKHMWTHTGRPQKYFECAACGWRTISKQCLRGHLQGCRGERR